jgi:hypothetical protein
MQPTALLILKAWVAKTPAFFIDHGGMSGKKKIDAG